LALRQAAGSLPVHSVRFTAPPDAVAALLQGKVDLQTIATLNQLAGTHEVVVGSFPQQGDGARASGSGAAALVTGLDGAPTSPAAVASTLTGLLQESLTVIAPSQITPGPEGVVVLRFSTVPD
jgi:hypothetical protein